MAKDGRYDPKWLAQFYDSYGEKEWARWDKSPEERVKLYIHAHYLKTYIRAGQSVLEVGAGSGRFTKMLADLGARIVVADISPGQLKLNKTNSELHAYKASVVDWIEADACELGQFADGQFDSVVAYGGLIGFVFERRAQAMSELLRVTAKGGYVLMSVMSLWGTVHSALESVLAVDQIENEQIIESGDLHPETYSNPNQRVHMFKAEELRDFLEQFPLQVECISACNSLTAGYGNRLEPLEKEESKWSYLLSKELESSREAGCLDIGSHMIAVASKQ
jgi:ubiquinone/menaquinone biosynthesis C-methylase UbiE